MESRAPWSRAVWWWHKNCLWISFFCFKKNTCYEHYKHLLSHLTYSNIWHNFVLNSCELPVYCLQRKTSSHYRASKSPLITIRLKITERRVAVSVPNHSNCRVRPTCWSPSHHSSQSPSSKWSTEASWRCSVSTKSMEQRPSWEANWSSASQEISGIVCNPNVHYHIYKSPLPVPVLNQIPDLVSGILHAVFLLQLQAALVSYIMYINTGSELKCYITLIWWRCWWW